MKNFLIIANFIWLGFLIYKIIFDITYVSIFIILLIIVPILTNIVLYTKKEKVRIIIGIAGFIANIILLLFLILKCISISQPSTRYLSASTSKNVWVLYVFLIVTIFNIIVIWIDLRKISRKLEVKEIEEN